MAGERFLCRPLNLLLLFQFWQRRTSSGVGIDHNSACEREAVFTALEGELSERHEKDQQGCIPFGGFSLALPRSALPVGFTRGSAIFKREFSSFSRLEYQLYFCCYSQDN